MLQAHTLLTYLMISSAAPDKPVHQGCEQSQPDLLPVQHWNVTVLACCGQGDRLK